MYTPGMGLEYRLTDGRPRSLRATATALTNASLKTQSRLHSLLRGLLGRDLMHHEDVTDEVLACIGSAYRINTKRRPARHGEMVFLNVTEIGPLVDMKALRTRRCAWQHRMNPRDTRR